MERIGLLLLVVLLAPAPVRAEVPPPVPAVPEGRDFGAGITLAKTLPLEQVLASPERYGQGAVLVRGRISDVCQKKGCWTVLQDGTARVRVRFVDYGFFLPTDSLGSEALVEGRVEVKTLSEKEARHYAAESRDGDPEGIHGPQREVGFLASGVRLVGRPAGPAE